MRDRIVLRTIRRYLRPGGVLYDVGSQDGRYGRHFVGRNVVYGFEPNPERQNPGFPVFPLALGARDGEAELFTHPRRDYFDSLHPAALSEKLKHRDKEILRIPIRVARLDSAARELKLEPPDLIKIDVQGSESDVLRGGENTLRTCRPVLVIEVHATLLPYFGSSPEELMEFLEQREYTIRFLARRGTEFHILALPRGAVQTR